MQLFNIFLPATFLAQPLPGKHPGGAVFQLANPVVDQGLVNAVLGAQLRNGLVPAQRRQGDLGLESRCMVPALCHFALLLGTSSS